MHHMLCVETGSVQRSFWNLSRLEAWTFGGKTRAYSNPRAKARIVRICRMSRSLAGISGCKKISAVNLNPCEHGENRPESTRLDGKWKCCGAVLPVHHTITCTHSSPNGTTRSSLKKFNCNASLCPRHFGLTDELCDRLLRHAHLLLYKLLVNEQHKDSRFHNRLRRSEVSRDL